MTLAALAIEPSYFAFDETDLRSGEELEGRILLLKSARRLLISGIAISILTSDDTDAELVRSNFYPYHDRLRELLHRLGLGTTYSANDVRVIVQDVIGRSESLEEYVGVRFALYEEGAMTSPDCRQCYSDGVLLGVFLEVLGIVSAGFAANPNLRDRLRLCCPPSSLWECLQFSGTLIGTEPDLGLERVVSEGHVLSNAYKSFLTSFDGLTLWRRAENAEEVVLSLFVGAIKRASAAGLVLTQSDIPVFQIGSAFVENLGDYIG